MVPHSRNKEWLDLFGLAQNIETLLVNTMEKWRVILCAGNSELGKVDIKWGIFQGDSLSHLVSALALIQSSFQKGQGSIPVFRNQTEDSSSII